MGKVLSRVLYQGREGYLGYYCPGCKMMHDLPISGQSKPNWVFNGNNECPTFVPSVLIRIGHYVEGKSQPPDCEFCNNAKEAGYPSQCLICHSFVTNGQIAYCSDTTHHLSGKTIPMESLPEWLTRKDWN